MPTTTLPENACSGVSSACTGIRRSLKGKLFAWLLLVSMLPLAFLGVVSSRMARESLRTSAAEALLASSEEKVATLDNWFHYRFTDLSYQTAKVANAELLVDLRIAFEASGTDLARFVKSEACAAIVEGRSHDLLTFRNLYHYHDVFLIDTEGNILFTVAHEMDHGTNLFQGEFSETRFARACRTALETGQPTFSDLERYLPSGDFVTGFVVGVIRDGDGQTIGLFAIQIPYDRIELGVRTAVDSRNHSQVYIVGPSPDGTGTTLRTELTSRRGALRAAGDQNSAAGSAGDFLDRAVDTEQTRLWAKEHGHHLSGPEGSPEVALVYEGPTGELVLGVHRDVRIGDIAWCVIAEVPARIAFAPAARLQYLGLGLMLLTGLLVVIVSGVVSGRIVRPIVQLSRAARRVADGDLNQTISTANTDELGALACVFNEMVAKLHQTFAELSSLKLAVDNHSIVSMTDLRGNITVVNSKFCELTGYSEEEVIGAKHSFFKSDEHSPEFYRDLWKTISSGNVWSGEIKNCAKDGSIYWVDATIVPFKDERGRITRYVAVRADITSRKLAAERLRKANDAMSVALQEGDESRRNAERSNDRLVRNEAQTKAILDSAADAIITVDSKGIVQSFNPAAVRTFGLERTEIIGQLVNAIIPASFRAAHDEGLARHVRTGERSILGRTVEVRGLRKDGTEFPLELTIEAVEGSDRGLFAAVARDITERKNTELAIKLARDEAEKADRAKSEFLANMSHEIRTPLTAILGFAESIADNVQRKENIEAIEIVRRNGAHLLHVINDILDLTKVEAGKLSVELIPCNPCDLIAEVVELEEDRARARGLVFEVEYDGGIPETIQTDPTRLRQILINLVGNAIKFTSSGGIRMIASHVCDGDASFLQFDIQDTGIGLTDEQIASLFQPFTQADNSTTRKFGGTGLGLTISKQFALLLGGDVVVVDSQFGVGTRFRATVATGPVDGIRLSQYERPTAAEVSRQRHAGAAPVSLAGYRVLLAEDGPDNQRLISFVLKKAGADVMVQENGKLALDAALEARANGRPFDCILMDMQMPIMNGYDATTALRDAGYHCPVIALTANAMAGDREKCIDAGCDDFANKPIDRARLISLIARHIRESAAAA